MAIGANTSRTRNNRKATPATGEVSMTNPDYIASPTQLLLTGRYTQNPCSGHFERN